MNILISAVVALYFTVLILVIRQFKNVGSDDLRSHWAYRLGFIVIAIIWPIELMRLVYKYVRDLKTMKSE